MGANVGKITGTLLADNLRRNGVNLAFNTNLLYIDVVNKRIGINTAAPVTDLNVNGTILTTNLIVDNSSSIANFTISSNNIQDLLGSITISPNQSSNPTITTPGLSTSNLYIYGNTVSDTVLNDNINITASGTGSINLNNNTLVNGNLHATGNVTWDGNITLGANSSDTVTFGADVNSNIIPSADNLYSLGSSSNIWSALYSTSANILTSTSIQTATITTSFTATGTNSFANAVIGASSADTLAVNASFNSNLIPSVTATYNLGSSSKSWNNLYVATIREPGITITSNSISSTTTNSDLKLIANNAYNVEFSALNLTNNANITGTLAVAGTSTLTNTATGNITQTGNYNQTGNASITGAFSATGNITGSSQLILPQVTINNSSIAGTASNTNLSIAANGTGQITLPSNNASITNNLSVGGTLTVSGTSTLTNTATGNITQTGNFNQTGNFTTSGYASVTGNITGGSQLILPQVTINNSSIAGTATNTNLSITANGTGQITLPSNNVSITKNLSVGGTLVVTGTSTLTNTATGNITQTGNYNQTGNASITGAFSATGNITGGNQLILPQVTVNNSSILGTANNTDLAISTNGTGQITLPSNNVSITKNLSVGGTLTVSGTSTLTNTATGNITQTGNYNQTGNASITGAFSATGNITGSNQLILPQVTINNSSIAGTATNTNLAISTNGTGQITLPNNNVSITNNLSVGGTLSVSGTSTLTNTATGNITQTGDYNQTGNASITGNATVTGNITVNGTYVDFGNISISGNTISSIVTNGNVTYTAPGTGGVWLGPAIKIQANNIYSTWLNVTDAILTEDLQQYISETGDPFYTEVGLSTTLASLVFSPSGSGQVKITTVNSLVLPIGNNSTQILNSNGEVRYNNAIYNYEGYESVGNVSFVGLRSQSGSVYVTSELTPGAADNTLRFAVNNTVTTTITSTTLTNNTMYAGNVNISNNIISNNASNDNLILPSGTGLVKFNTTPILDSANNIHVSTGANTFYSSNNGYSKFTGTFGTVLPVGTSSNYPSSPEVGAVRYTSDHGYAEVYNGTTWISIGGSANYLSQSQVTDVMFIWDIILG